MPEQPKSLSEVDTQPCTPDKDYSNEIQNRILEMLMQQPMMSINNLLPFKECKIDELEQLDL